MLAVEVVEVKIQELLLEELEELVVVELELIMVVEQEMQVAVTLVVVEDQVQIHRVNRVVVVFPEL